MKILQVTNFFKPSWEAGGPVRATYELSKSLIEKGNEVTVYTTDGFKYRLDVEKNKPVSVDGINTYYFRNVSLYLSKKMNLPLPYFAPIVIKKDIKKFDVIHIHEYRTFLAVVIHYYAKKNNIPYILQPRGSLPLLGKEKQKKVFDSLFGRSIIDDAKMIIASSEHESYHYLKSFPNLNPEKVVHIPNGIDVKCYQNLPRKGTFRSKFMIDRNDKVVLFLGRIHEIKGLELLVGSFSNLISIFENTKLVIAGPDDGYLAKLEGFVEELNISDNVIFTGPLYEQDKIEALVDADVFVLPSKYESFGNVVFEACACGTPVIVTDRCGVSKYMNNDLGYVIEYDKYKLSDALFDVLSNSKFQHKPDFSSNGIMNFQYSWESISSKMIHVYSKLAGDKTL
ncbi:glycosyltransferase [Methanolobus sp. WCC5]|uniref:glycosyltransferase n=1 Tax=Methanolobus sp. WCC5 TaxID=3125785 RepID=UPI003244B45B